MWNLFRHSIEMYSDILFGTYSDSLTDIYSLRSGGAHSDLALAVEVPW